jgi:dolichyl-phosphate beta-glucosyltransferase
MNGPYLSVIVPAYNEEHRLGTCLRSLTDYLWGYTHYMFEIIVVDNGSTDHTIEVAQNWQEEWPQVRIISIPERGKGRAIRTGMLHANGSYLYMADADLATPATEIPHFLLTMVNGCQDVVIGVRPEQTIEKKRKLFHHGWQLLTAALVPGILDPQCGFKLFTATAAYRLFSASWFNGFAFDVEILMLARKMGMTIGQIPVPWENGAGSKVSPMRDTLGMAKELFKLPISMGRSDK